MCPFSTSLAITIAPCTATMAGERTVLKVGGRLMGASLHCAARVEHASSSPDSAAAWPMVAARISTPSVRWAGIQRAGWRLRWNEQRYGRGVDVVVTHAAPLGIHDGEDLCHHGFEAFVGLMRRYRPRLLVHGHVHPSYGWDVEPRRFEATEVRSVYGYEILRIEP
jgi:hypothetical protein